MPILPLQIEAAFGVRWCLGVEGRAGQATKRRSDGATKGEIAHPDFQRQRAILDTSPSMARWADHSSLNPQVTSRGLSLRRFVATSLRRFLLITLVLAAAGCVQRTISITSKPSGALVLLNDEEAGRTPLTIEHRFYGVYDVRLEATGHRPLWTKKAAKAPWWEAPGPDLVAEMIPGAKVQQQWHFELEPIGEVDLDALHERAKQMSQLLE